MGRRGGRGYGGWGGGRGRLYTYCYTVATRMTCFCFKKREEKRGKVIIRGPAQGTALRQECVWLRSLGCLPYSLWALVCSFDLVSAELYAEKY